MTGVRHELKDSDTLPEIADTDQNTAEDLTGGSVTLVVESTDGTLIVNDTASVDDATQGSADFSYQLSASQTGNTGLHKYEWVITYSDGDQQTIPPGNEYYYVTFGESLDTSGSVSAASARSGPIDTLLFNELSSDPSAPATDDWGVFFKTDGNLYKIDENGTVTQVGGGSASISVEDDGTEIVSTVGVFNFAGGQFDVTNPAGDQVNVVIGTDVIQTDELDLSITPTWTGQHVFNAGIDIEGNWVIDSESEATVERLRIQGTGVDDPAELFLQAKGASDVSRYTATPDSSTSNFSGITLESNGTHQIIDSITEGTASALPLVIRIDGTTVMTVGTDNSVTFDQITGSPTMAGHDHSEGGMTVVPNAGLANSSVTVAGNAVSLGGSTSVAFADLTGSVSLAQLSAILDANDDVEADHLAAANLPAHSSRHQDGGADELDVAELAGGLGTVDQVPISDGAAVTWGDIDLDNIADSLDKDALDGSVGTDGQVWTSTGTGAQWEAASGGAGRELSASTSQVALSDTEEITLWRGTAPAGATLEVNDGSVSNDSGNAPTGLKIVLENVTDATTTDLITSTYNNGSPISSHSVGGDDIKIKLVNSTGSPQNAQADLGAVFA